MSSQSSSRANMATPASANTAPKAFISYSWDDDAHREWVKDLATRLRADGVDVTLDRWHAAPGDQVPAFMERAVRENKFVIAVCTPRFKKKSDERDGGVGYEGDIMTAHAFTGRGKKKFIPVLRRGSWEESAPDWLLGKFWIDLSGDLDSETGYDELLRTLLGAREEAPPLGLPRIFGNGKGWHPDPTSAPATPPAGSTTPQRRSTVSRWVLPAVGVVALGLVAWGVATYPGRNRGAEPKTPDNTGATKTVMAREAHLEGSVTDAETAAPLVGVTLAITDGDFRTYDGKSPMATTDEAGRFSLKFLDRRPSDDPARQVRLVATKVGYATSTTDPPLGSTDHPIKLKPLPPK